MNHEAMVISLRQLKYAITQARLALDVNPVKPDAADFNLLMLRAKVWQQQIELMQRELKSRAHLTAMVAEQNRFGPGSFQAGQRAASQNSNIAALRMAALAAAAALADLVRKAYEGPPDIQKALDAVSEILDGIQGQSADTSSEMQAFSLGHQGQKIEATIRQATPAEAAPLPIASGGFDVFMLLFGLVTLLIALRRKN